MPTAPNFANRTVWTGDNLDILRGLNSDSVDLIYLDPPLQQQSDLRRADRQSGRWRGIQGHVDAVRP